MERLIGAIRSEFVNVLLNKSESINFLTFLLTKLEFINFFFLMLQ